MSTETEPAKVVDLAKHQPHFVFKVKDKSIVVSHSIVRGWIAGTQPLPSPELLRVVISEWFGMMTARGSSDEPNLPRRP